MAVLLFIGCSSGFSGAPLRISRACGDEEAGLQDVSYCWRCQNAQILEQRNCFYACSLKGRKSPLSGVSQ